MNLRYQRPIGRRGDGRFHRDNEMGLRGVTRFPQVRFVNGLITNDKFCLTRYGQIPLRKRTGRARNRFLLQTPAATQGGSDEAAVDGAAPRLPPPNGAAPLGSTLSATAADDSQPAVPPTGGV